MIISEKKIIFIKNVVALGEDDMKPFENDIVQNCVRNIITSLKYSFLLKNTNPKKNYSNLKAVFPN